MSMDFDLGPLSWVQGEIDQALTRGLTSLGAFRKDPGDATSLKHARSHVHQAAGAIQMVGLDAVVAYTDELERQLLRLEDMPAEGIPAVCDVIERACQKLKIFLDELVNGAPPVPLKLYPEYEAMQGTRGITAVAPTDLFYPDLSPRAPRIAPRESMPPNRLPSYLVKQRRLYQRGLLAWLRGDEGGAATMREAIAGIEDATTQGSLRAFWWSVGAMFEGLVGNGLDGGFGVKQLAARIDLQIRRVAEGSAKVADRLRREVLYFVAICAPVAPQVQAVQKAYKLSGLIPSAEVLSADVVRLQPLLREAREQLAGAKDSWLKAASGRAENLPRLKQTLVSVHAKAAEIRNGALMKLTSALVERLDKMPASGVTEPVAMEYATALLLAESAFENYTSLSSEFPRQVDAMLARLDAARQGRQAAASGAPMLDEMSKRAQERVLLAQVGRDIQANLRHMEQVLDAFFRDNAKRAELATLAKDSAQIRGALRILGLDDADRLLGLCEEQIATYADPDTAVSNDDLELLAESLSGLGFYIEAVEQQRPDRDRLIAPLIAKRLGEAPVPIRPEESSVEAAVAELRAALPKLVGEVERAGNDATAREGLRQKLSGLRDDAELIGDIELVGQTDAILAELAASGTANLAAQAEAIADLSAPAPELSEETQRLLATDAHGLDHELLEIYLLEAAEVLDGIAEHHRVLSGNPGDREALATVRRGFHTLKGSGRMVGLTELGEFAFDAERVMNRLLEEERPVTPAVLAMIAVAQTSFRGWVEALTHERRVVADPRAMRAAIVQVERELPGGDTGDATPANAADADGDPEPEPEPAPASNVIELPRWAGVTAGPAAGHQHTAELIELPELGFNAGAPEATPMAPVAELIELVDLPLPEVNEPVGLRLVEPSGPHAFELPPEAGPGRTEAVDDDVAIGDVTLSRSLWSILCDEADQHLTTLEHERGVLQFEPHAVPSAAMVRASHTLCGIHRTGGFPMVAATAKSLEQTLIALEQRGAPMPGSAHPVIARAIAALTVFVQRIKAQTPFTAADADEAAIVQREVDELRQDAAIEVVDAEAAAAELARREEEPRDAAAPATEGPAAGEAADPNVGMAALPEAPAAVEREPAHLPASLVLVEAGDVALPRPVVDPLAGVRDDVDAQVLSIFLDEAAELFPQAGEGVRAWRRNPRDEEVVADLRRTLHTFKGSARMAGAMRLGELTHLMESRLNDGDAPVLPSAALFDQLDEDLDHIAHVLDGLRRGEFDVPLPGMGPVEADLPRAGMEVGFDASEAPASVASPPANVRAPDHDNVVSLVPSAVPQDDAPAAPAPPGVEPLLPAAAVGQGSVPEDTDDRHGVDEVDLAATAPAVEPPALPVVPVAIPAAIPVIATADSTPPPAAIRAETVPELESGPRAQLRVRADIIDRLVNEAGEVAIARARVEGELRALKSNLLELTNSVIRLRGQMREIEIQAESQIQSQMTLLQEQHGEFDPLEFDRYTRFQELTRSLAEGINDVSTVQQSLLKNLDDADAALLAQARLSREVQQRLFSIRTVPFGSLSERLYRILRVTARELDKRVNLEIHGGQVELDRSVLEKLAGPLEHLLRNALDHGIESREARRDAGKSETGEIALTVRQVGNEVVIELGDDGAGIEFGRVRDRARGLGLITADAEPTEAQMIEFLFEPGFSTASKVTQISGRGIGMDVVRSEIAALGGRVEVTSKSGGGTKFVLTMPLTLAVAQAVLIRAGGRLWALPAPMVEQVQQVKSQVLLDIYVQRKVEWQGRSYPFHYLPRLLGDMSHNPETKRYNSVLLLRSGQNHAAIHIDEMIGNQEVVVKNIGPQLARVSGISGATVLGTGEIVLIINPVQLAGRADVPKHDPTVDRAMSERPRAPVAVVNTQPLVLIVDDSLTVRKITSRLLLREGFAVATAKDGVDALQVLAEQLPDVILLDIEMPRMDGFEFAKTVKGDTKYAGIPIIMITSRTAEKHRNRAAELGVDLYLGKPFQEDELLGHLREMTGAVAPG
jgi:chemosensory pili system protein ChpA (sensor histidine kinase/response regulator)